MYVCMYNLGKLRGVNLYPAATGGPAIVTVLYNSRAVAGAVCSGREVECEVRRGVVPYYIVGAECGTRGTPDPTPRAADRTECSRCAQS